MVLVRHHIVFEVEKVGLGGAQQGCEGLEKPSERNLIFR